MRHLVISLFMLAAMPITLLAQSTYGSILGTVNDPTGARIASVSLTITNQGEDISRTVLADELGNYEVLNLKGCVYSVKCEAPGFRAFQARDLQLVARQALRINVTLEVGSVSETISVSTA